MARALYQPCSVVQQERMNPAPCTQEHRQHTALSLRAATALKPAVPQPPPPSEHQEKGPNCPLLRMPQRALGGSARRGPGSVAGGHPSHTKITCLFLLRCYFYPSSSGGLSCTRCWIRTVPFHLVQRAGRAPCARGVYKKHLQPPPTLPPVLGTQPPTFSCPWSSGRKALPELLLLEKRCLVSNHHLYTTRCPGFPARQEPFLHTQWQHSP